MRLSENQIIVPKEKITDYLIVPKKQNDKLFFLAKLGYSLHNYQDLINDIKFIAVTGEIVLSRESEYGSLYKINGLLKDIMVVTIWFEQISYDAFRFVTLYPV